jgi:hypothetical protein
VGGEPHDLDDHLVVLAHPLGPGVADRHRLRERGFSEQACDLVTCPIGVPGIAGKEPEVIAVAAAAQSCVATWLLLRCSLPQGAE